MNKKVVIGIGVIAAGIVGWEIVSYMRERKRGIVAAQQPNSFTPAPTSNLRPSSPAAQAIRTNEVAQVYPVAPIAQKVQTAQPIAIAQPVKASEPVYMPSPAPVRSMVIQPSTSLPQPSEAKREFLSQREQFAGWANLLR